MQHGQGMNNDLYVHSLVISLVRTQVQSMQVILQRTYKCKVKVIVMTLLQRYVSKDNQELALRVELVTTVMYAV